MNEDIVIPIAGIIMIIVLSLGVPLVRSYIRRMESQPRDALPSGDVVARLERIEQAVEAVSTEVERIAEGQRFTTRLLSEGGAKPVHVPAAAPPVAQASAPDQRAGGQMQSDGTILVEAARRT